MGEISDRRVYTCDRIKELREQLRDAELIANGNACVYAAGSYGRSEASPYSDLDIFIVGKSNAPELKKDRQLSRLDEIRIKSKLIEVSRSLEFPEFSKDGEYLTYHSVDDFTKTLGTENDDATNTFTARLLLLLESCVLIGNAVYHAIAKQVVDAYWRDFGDHRSDFMPAFLANDILRLWRTFCVNYEARTEREPGREKAEGKMKNYKLKHSRIMTCYSAILYLLAVYVQNRTVTQQNAIDMFNLTPTQRIEWLMQQQHPEDVNKILAQLLEQYEKFLATTNVAEEELVKRFLDPEQSRELLVASKCFGKSVYEALTKIDKDSPFLRMLVV